MKTTDFKMAEAIINGITFEEIEQLFIDNDYEDLDGGVLRDGDGVFMEVVGNCDVTRKEARVPSGETRVMDQDEERINRFYIEGTCTVNDTMVNFKFDSEEMVMIINDLK